MQFEHAVWYTEVVGRHQNGQLKLLGIYIFNAFHDGHMLWQSLLQIVRAFIADIHQQGCRLPIDESKDTLIHVVVAGDSPVEAFCKSVECPEASIVALRGDDLAPSDDSSHLAGQVVRPAHMTAEHRNDVLPKAVDAHHRRVFVLVLHERCNCPHTDAHRPDEDESIVVLPLTFHFRALDGLCAQLSLQGHGNLAARLANWYNGYFHAVKY